MSQSDYIKYKKMSATLKKNKFFPILDQGLYLNNEEYFTINQVNNHITSNQLAHPNSRNVFGANVNKATYSTCVVNSQKLKCHPKSNYVVPNHNKYQYNPTVKATPVHKDCIHIDENLYCNGNKHLKPITYINKIKYIDYKRTKDNENKFNANTRNERINFVPVFKPK